MPEYKLPEKFPVKLLLEDEQREYTAEICEVFDGHVLVRVPNELAEVEPGTRVTLEFGHQKQYWQVNADAHAHFSVWWFLDEPNAERWENKQRRRFVRIRHDGQVVAMPHAGATDEGISTVNLTFRDLSACGACVIADAPLNAQRLTLMLALPDLGATAIAARVIREFSLPDGQHAYGLDFDHRTPKIRDDMMEFVLKQIQRHLATGHDITC